MNVTIFPIYIYMSRVQPAYNILLCEYVQRDVFSLKYISYIDYWNGIYLELKTWYKMWIAPSGWNGKALSRTGGW